jgi:hypothetical protein
MFNDSGSIQPSLDGWEGLGAAKQQSAHPLLIIPKLAASVPCEVQKFGSGSGDPLGFAASVGLFAEPRYEKCANVASIFKALSAHLSEMLTIEHKSGIRFRVAVRSVGDVVNTEPQPAGCHEWYGTDQPTTKRNEVDGSGIAFAVSIEKTAGMCPLKPSLEAWNALAPDAEKYIAVVLQAMNAAPYIVTPFDIQGMYSEYYFELGEEQGEYEKGEVDSLYQRSIIESLPEQWRSAALSAQSKGEGENTAPHMAVKKELSTSNLLLGTANAEVQQLRAAGELVLALTKTHRSNSSLAFYSDIAVDDIYVALYYDVGDFLQGHFDLNYENVMQYGDVASEALVAAVKCDRPTLDALVQDLRNLFIYIDACAAFVELIIAKDS